MFSQPTSVITLKDAWMAIYVLAGIAAIGFGIIGGLSARVGGFRRLLRLTAGIAEKRARNTKKRKADATDLPKDKAYFKD